MSLFAVRLRSFASGCPPWGLAYPSSATGFLLRQLQVVQNPVSSQRTRREGYAYVLDGVDRRLKHILDKCHRLNPSHVEALPAPDILAPDQVVPTHHVALGLGEPCPVTVVGSARQLRFLTAHQPPQFIFGLLAAVRTRHHMRTLLRPLIKKITLFHPAPRRTPNRPIWCPASGVTLLRRRVYCIITFEQSFSHYEEPNRTSATRKPKRTAVSNLKEKL